MMKTQDSQRFFRTIRLALALLLAPASGALAQITTNLILDFENQVLPSGVTVQQIGGFNSLPGIKAVTNFGSAYAFGFGRSTCGANCFENDKVRLSIALPTRTFVSQVSFREFERYGNWGGKGRLYVDGVVVPNAIFGRSPSNDQNADTTNRFRQFSIGQMATNITIEVWDITTQSEIVIDDVVIGGPQFLNCGDVVQGSITYLGQSNVYTFAGAVGDVIRLSSVSLDGFVGPDIDIFNPSGVYVGGFGYNDGVSTLALTTNGTFMAIVRDRGNNNTGTYSLGLVYATPKCATIPLSCGTVITNTITDPSQQHTYSLSGIAGEIIRLTSVSLDGFVGPDTDVFSPTGERLTTIGYNDGVSTFTLPANGNYLVIVRDRGNNNTGLYSLGLVYATPKCAAIALSCGTVITNVISNPAQQHRYVLNASSGDVVHLTSISLDRIVGPDIDVFNPSGIYVGGFGYQDYVSSLTLSNAGPHIVIVRDRYNDNTGTYSLTLNTLNQVPLLLLQTNSFTVLGGSNLTFTASATNLCLPGSVFSFSLPSAPAGAMINASNGVFTWTAPSIASPSNFLATVRVTDTNLPPLSDERVVTITVIPSCQMPIITEQPQSLSVVAGSSANFTVAASGTGPLDYQWRKNTVPLPGATNVSFGIIGATTNDVAAYSVIVSNACGSVLSANAQLAITTPAVLRLSAANYTTAEGSTNFGVVIERTGDTNSAVSVLLTTTNVTASAGTDYVGQTNVVNLAAGETNVFVAIGILADALIESNESFTITLSNPAGTTLGNPAVATVTIFDCHDPVILTNPHSQTVCAGGTAVFTVSATNVAQAVSHSASGGPAEDRFILDGGANAGVVRITYEMYTIKDTLHVYYDGVRIFDSGLTNGARTVTIPYGPGTNTAVEIVINEGSGLSGTAWNYQATLTPLALSYQWQLNGVNIPGATNATLALTSVQASHEGTYGVYVLNACGVVLTAPATLSVHCATISAPQMVGSNAVLTVTGPVGSLFILQTTTNMASWLSIATNVVPPSGAYFITNAPVTGDVFRAYRVVTP